MSSRCPSCGKKTEKPILDKEQLKEQFKKYVEDRDKKAKTYVV